MFPQDFVTQMRRRRVFEPLPTSVPPVAIEQEAEMGKSDPWSERLPDGRTVNEAVMQAIQNSNKGPSQVAAGRAEMDALDKYPELRRRVGQGMLGPVTLQQEQAASAAGQERWGLPTQGLPPRADYEPGQNIQDSYSGIEQSSGSESRPWKVGTAISETDPLKKEAARIRAMIENPRSEVSASGSVAPVHPMGKVKGALLGGLFGLAQGGPNTPLAARLAAGATGLGIGAVKPSLVQGWRRRMEVDDAQDQLAQQQKIVGGQTQIDRGRADIAETEAGLMPDPNDPTRMIKRPAQRAPQYIERSDGVYEVSAEHPNGRRVASIPAEVKASKRGAAHYFEREDGVYATYEDTEGNLKSFKVEGIPGKPASDAQESQAAEGEAIASSTKEAASTLTADLDQNKGQLLKNEEAIAKKESWWNSQAAKLVAESAGELKLADALAQVQANDPDYVNGTYAQTVGNTKALRDAVGEKEKRLAGMAEDIRKGQAKSARGGRRSTPYSGRTMSQANLARYAKDKGLSIDEARRKVEAQGVRVQ